ncbi:MAG: thiosulfate oxidation carrier complex protein SoxZ [Proteobacteria bacterium]|nr:MAG: thiosulfate oxidation carrier complex protein SoxZ [Pseudomonadota bacterium]
MANPMKIRAKTDGDIVQVRLLISHVMETGLRKDAQGALIPAHYIQLIEVRYEGRTVLSAQWGPAVSRNPYFAFKFRGGSKGGKLRVTWTDSLGEKGDGEAAVE